MNNDNLDPRLFNLLDEVKPVSSRDSHAAARGRTRFLTEVVSLREQPRHSGWMIFPFKEQLAMKLIVSILVIVGLLFGGGTTVFAAQDDLPNEPLYQVKLMSDDARLWFVSDPMRQIDILLAQAQTRLQEMQTLLNEGIVPPTDVAVRAQERIQRALQIATQLDEESKIAVLQQFQARLQAQEQLMLHLEQGACTECVPVLQQTREMLRLHLSEVENRLVDPATLQNQNQNQTQTQNQNQLRINQTPQTDGTSIPHCGTCTPVMDGNGQQNGSGDPSGATPVQQQNQTQQQNQSGGGGQTGHGSGSEGGSTNGSGGGSGGHGGKP